MEKRTLNLLVRRRLPAILMMVPALLVLAPIVHAEKGPPKGHIDANAKTGADASKSGPPFDLKDASRIAAGKSRFNSTCAQFCHGNEPALFIGRSDLEIDYVFNTIREGGKGATPMPPWGEVFEPEEIWELVAYVKSLGTW